MKYLGSSLRLSVSLVGLCTMAGLAGAQPAGQLSAREIFYGAATPPQAKATKAAPAASAASTQKAQAAPKPAPPKPQPAAAPPPAPATAVAAAPPVAPAAPAAAPPAEQASRPASTGTSSVARADQTGTLKTVAYTRQPLGIRLSVLKVEQNGDRKEVPPDTNFRPGDRVRLNIQVSASGYLYIINRGSSGTWTQLFPSPDLPAANNALEPGATYSIPSDRNFVVSNPPGNEKMFLILSRQPVANIQSLILDMSRRSNGAAAPEPEPKAPAQAAPQMLADSRGPINDAAVDRLRTFYARDLVIETVDQQTPGTVKENAVYAVSTGDGDDTRVVLDAQIKHQ